MNKTYCITDLHGQYQLWEKIKSYIDATDTLYFLGDAIDRGPNGLKIMLELLEMPNVIYLKGNHENFFVEGAVASLNDFNPPLWVHSNGGYTTVEEIHNKWNKDNPTDVTELSKIVKKIRNLPYKAEYINKKGQKIRLSHSGYWDYLDANDNYCWDRKHILESWDYEDNSFIVHGHTPSCNVIEKIYNNKALFAETTQERGRIIGEGQQLLADWNKEPFIYKYANNHKIALDLGSFITNKIALFNLDTLTVETYFTGDNND